jgi:chloride channel protein, CIC family
VLRINTGIRQQPANAGTGVTLGDVAHKDFTIVHEQDAVFDLIGRMSRRGAMMAMVVNTTSNRAIPRPSDIRGVITKEHVADSVAESISIYPD